MNLIMRDTDYAVRALCYMARNPEQVASVTSLGARFAIPRQYLRRILQTLARHQILESSRGQGGGFKLRKDPSRILLSDLMGVFHGALDFTRCVFRSAVCPNQASCPLRKTVKRIEKNALLELRATTIASLVAGQPDDKTRRKTPEKRPAKARKEHSARRG